MSVLSNLQAGPSRMLGLLRLLATLADREGERENLRNLWWPRAERPENRGTDFFSDTIRELVAADLVKEERVEGVVSYTLGGAVPEVLRDADAIAVHGVELFTDSLFATPDDRNGDLGHVLAWWLAQPVAAVPPTPNDLATVWSTQVDAEALLWRTPGEDKPLNVNTDRARQLRSWAVYLGLGWEHGPSPQATPHLQPDPTRHLRLLLERVLPNRGEETPINEAWDAVAERAPFLDGGRYHRALAEAGLLPDYAPQAFSEPVSLALLRLEAEGFIRLTELSDASADALRVLTWAEAPRRCTHVTRL